MEITSEIKDKLMKGVEEQALLEKDKHGFHKALLPTLVLLSFVSVQSSATFCQGCSAEALSRMKQQLISMRKPTQKLYKSYVQLNGMQKRKRVCEKALPWFPDGNITQEDVGVVLRELHRTLELMEDSLAQITEQQKSFQDPTSLLPRELQYALLTAQGLHVNTRCALCNGGLAPIAVPLPPRRTEPAFHQKVRGCQVLWNYSRFVSALAKAFQKQLHKKRMTKKRSGQRPYETF